MQSNNHNKLCTTVLLLAAILSISTFTAIATGAFRDKNTNEISSGGIAYQYSSQVDGDSTDSSGIIEQTKDIVDNGVRTSETEIGRVAYLDPNDNQVKSSKLYYYDEDKSAQDPTFEEKTLKVTVTDSRGDVLTDDSATAAISNNDNINGNPYTVYYYKDELDTVTYVIKDTPVDDYKVQIIPGDSVNSNDDNKDKPYTVTYDTGDTPVKDFKVELIPGDPVNGN